MGAGAWKCSRSPAFSLGGPLGCPAGRHVGRLIVSNRPCRSVWFLEPYLGNACGGCWRIVDCRPSTFFRYDCEIVIRLKISIDWEVECKDGAIFGPSFHSLYSSVI